MSLVTQTLCRQYRCMEGSSNNRARLTGLRVKATYSITVRAYQQLLGPASNTISVQTLPGIATAPFNVLITLLMYSYIVVKRPHGGLLWLHVTPSWLVNVQPE